MSEVQLLERLKPRVDKTIKSLRKTKFRVDPIGGAAYSRATSIVSAAYKRHGQILEEAIRIRLSDCDYFSVWHEPDFQIPSMADHAIAARNAELDDSLPIELPYDQPGQSRSIQIDALVFDKRIGSLRSYEIKRGNGYFDSGKKRSILRDVLATQALLKSYGAKHSMIASIVESRVIAYYGIKPLPAPYSLAGDELDDHFVFPVTKYVEEVNDYFRTLLYQLLQEVGSPAQMDMFEDLCERCPMRNGAVAN